MIYNRLRAAVVTGTAAVALGTGMAVAAPAAQADPYRGCPDGALCAWVQKNFGGDPGKVYQDNEDLLQYPAFDNAKSVFNNGRQCAVTIYTQRSYRGIPQRLPRATGYGDLETQNPPFFRNIASNRWC